MLANSNLLETIETDESTLSRAFRKIAEAIRLEPESFIHSPIRELSQAIGVSEPTLIRFARHYGYKGLPEMRLALAMAMASLNAATADSVEPALIAKEVVNRAAKQEIARLAASYLADDRSIIMDSGSTVQFMTQYMQGYPKLTVMTTGLNVMMALARGGMHEVMLPGGVVRPSAMSLGGRMVERALSELVFDTVYLGADSVAPGFGLSTFREDEAHINRAMIRSCRRVIVLVDHTKFKSPSLHRICGLSEVDVVISDDQMPEEMQEAIRAEGPRLELAPGPRTESKEVDSDE